MMSTEEIYKCRKCGMGYHNHDVDTGWCLSWPPGTPICDDCGEPGWLNWFSKCQRCARRIRREWTAKTFKRGLMVYAVCHLLWTGMEYTTAPKTPEAAYARQLDSCWSDPRESLSCQLARGHIYATDECIAFIDSGDGDKRDKALEAACADSDDYIYSLMRPDD
jgi:hypothetical protein